MPVGPVQSTEILWRSIRPDQVAFPNGILKISATAFNDKNMKPSMDRKNLRSLPEETRLNDGDGVAQIITADVRAISILVSPEDEDPQKRNQKHNVNVIARPILLDNLGGEKENLAHAQVKVEPDYINASRFNKLKEALARLALKQPWAIQPKATA